MSITDSDSVLILGAGVSAPFGLSLGGDLIGQISNQIMAELQNREARFLHNLIQDHPREAFQIAPIMASYLVKEKDDPKSDYTMVAKRAVESLEASTHDTIDDFMIDYPSLAPFIKIAVAVTIFNQTYSSGQKTGHSFSGMSISIDKVSAYEIKSFKQRNISVGKRSSLRAKSVRNWVHRLVNIVRFGVRNIDKFSTVKIITFNYDSLLEYVMEEVFDKTEKTYNAYDNYVEIEHMHGTFGKLDVLVDNPMEVVLRWAKEICVVQEENVPESIQASRDKARRWVANANKIYAVGFAFSGANCRLLGLGTGTASKKKIYYCNYDGNMGITQAVKRIFGTDQKMMISTAPKFDIYPAEGTPDKPVSVEDWFASGFAGETPA